MNVEALPAIDRAARGCKPKPEAVVREAEGALRALANGVTLRP